MTFRFLFLFLCLFTKKQLFVQSSTLDFYNILGVNKNCNSRELKHGYYKKALLWHPDKNQHNLDISKQKFLKIQGIYDILKDPYSRSLYERCGANLCTGKNVIDNLEIFKESQDSPNFDNNINNTRSVDTSTQVKPTIFTTEKDFTSFINTFYLNGPRIQIMFTQHNSKVKILNPHKIPGIGKYYNNKFTWIILLCKQLQYNCNKHANNFQLLADRIDRYPIKIGFLDCTTKNDMGDSICNLFKINNEYQKPVVIRINNGNGKKILGLYNKLGLSIPNKELDNIVIEEIVQFGYNGLYPKILTHIHTTSDLGYFVSRCNKQCRNSDKRLCVLVFTKNKHGGSRGINNIANTFEFDNRSCVVIGEVLDSNPENVIAQRLGINVFPSISIINPKNGEIIDSIKITSVRSAINYLKTLSKL